MTMIPRWTLFTKVLLILTMSVALFSCNETTPKRATISPGQMIDEEGPCPEGFHEETKKEKNTETGVEEEITECVEDPKVRPTSAVIFKTDFCGCKDDKAVTYGNCASFCSGKNTQKAETFFANFTVTADIALSGLGSVHGWCNVVLPGETSNPKCELEVKSEDNTTIMLDVTTPAGTNSITADISSLAQDKTYVLTLVETVSKARSSSVQIVKFSPDIGIPILGPLKNAPISQYTCIIRDSATGSGDSDVYYEQSYRTHYYFLPRRPPSPIPPGTGNIACHDISLLGLTDDVLYPRLEQIPGAFNLWDTSDPRFFDNNGNTIMDVDDIIQQKAKNFGVNLPSTAKFFSPFSWANEPELGDEATVSKNAMPLGYYMQPWIDGSTYRSYCLNSTHYNSNNGIFKAIRDVVGVDTEGLYIAEKTTEAVTSVNGSTTTAGSRDFILIRETDLKQVWFYLNNGIPTAPTDENVANVAVFFYYPLNKASPFVKTSTQRIFQVKSPQELFLGGSTTTPSGTGSSGQGAPTAYPPHDRKMGCIPKF